MIQREQTAGILTLRLAHGKANTLDAELCEEIIQELRDAEASDARAVILTGTGSIFSAGVDLFRMTDGGEDYVRRFFPALRDAFVTLFRFPKPIVAAVNGHAIAGGCLLAAACDYRLMSSGKIGVPELLVGVPFPAIAIEILRFACGPNAQSLAYSGRTVSPEEARSVGLIDDTVESDDLMIAAQSVAQKFAALGGTNFAITKRQLRSASVEQMEKLGATDDDAIRIWSSPQVHTHIRDYLSRTVGKK